MSSGSRKTAPLNPLLKKRQPTKFDSYKEGKAAVDQLKHNLINPMIPALPMEDAPFNIQTNACNIQVGHVLLQTQQDDNDLRSIGYWSQTVNDTEMKYDTTQQERLAVVWAILLLRPYIEGSRFVVRTDYQGLCWILDLKKWTGQLAR